MGGARLSVVGAQGAKCKTAREQRADIAFKYKRRTWLPQRLCIAFNSNF